MKRVSCARAVLTTGLAGWVCLFSFQAQSASLSVTPSSITNDFQGTVVLNITGLPTGQTVAVEEYLDANGNGIIEAGPEYLVQAFTVTDGRVMSIGGVRNRGVPGDEDGLTNGQIRVELAYPGVNETLDRIAANYLFRIYDPEGGFTPRTNSFSIAQKVFPQGVSGKVTAAGTGLPLSNAVVVLVMEEGPGSGTVADGGGNFTLYGGPGDYFLVAVQNGSVDDQSSGGVTLGSGSFVTKNITNFVADRTLSGKVADSASGEGLPGIFVQAESSDGLFSLMFSDASGNFTLPAIAGQWKVKVGGDSGVSRLGYLPVGNKINTDVTSGSASNLNFQFVKPSALIYGTVRDNQSNAVSGLALKGQDFSYTYELRGQTDAQGNYSVGVFAGSWNIGPDNEQLAASGLIGQGVNISITNGQALRQDFIVQHAATHLRGRVIDGSGAPLGNMELVVQIFTGQGPGSTSFYPQTQGDGTFDVGVFAGHWELALECSSAGERGVVGPHLEFDVVDGVDRSNITLIARAVTGHIAGTIQDINGTPIHAQVYASTTVNGVNYSACGSDTDENGNFDIPTFDGQWQVGISGDLTSRGYDNPANRTASVSGGICTVSMIIYPQGQTPPSLVPSGYYNGHFQFRLNGSPDQRYRIEASTNVNNPASWVVLRTNTAFGGTFEFVDTNAPSASHRFYRAVLVP